MLRGAKRRLFSISKEDQRKIKSFSGLQPWSRVTPGAMAPTDAKTAKTPLHPPAGIFVIHLRSDSDLSRQHAVGRVEHVMSGDSAPFVSLAALLAFMDRHAVEGGK